jgi:hypothetical protein
MSKKFGLGFNNRPLDQSAEQQSSSTDARNGLKSVQEHLSITSKSNVTVGEKMIPRKEESKMEALKRKMNEMLERTNEEDKKNKVWESHHMTDISKKMKADEVECTGTGFVGEVNDHNKLISMINSEEFDSLYSEEAVEQYNRTNEKEVASNVSSSTNNISKRELLHYDAMFSVCDPATVCGDNDNNNNNNKASTNKSDVFSNKFHKQSDPFITGNSNVGNNDDGEDELPIWKRLHVGQAVEARCSYDGRWYSAVIKQVIHGGYSNALYTVQYSDNNGFNPASSSSRDDNNTETRSWRDIKIAKNGKFDYDKRFLIVNPISEFQPAAAKQTCNHHEQQQQQQQQQQQSPIIPKASINPNVIEKMSVASQGGWRARAKKR